LDRGYGKPTQPLSGDAAAPPIGLFVADESAEIERKRAAARAMLEGAFGKRDGGGANG
jgi:hypothetical protein